MSIRTTVTLDEDVLERVKAESRARGLSFRETFNQLLRLGLDLAPAAATQALSRPAHAHGISSGFELRPYRVIARIRRRREPPLILLDANILLYAYNADAPQQAAVAAWLEDAMGGPEPVGLPLPSIWAFLRISTNSRIWPKPKGMAEALQIVREMLSAAGAILVQPGPRHLEILEDLTAKYGIAGPSVTHAVLAAMAMENGAALASTDRGFSRFQNLRSINPLA